MSQSHKVTTAADSINAIKCKLANGQPVLGIWSIIPSPIVVEILSLSGFDFAILDMEHGVFDLTSLDACIRAVELLKAASAWQVVNGKVVLANKHNELQPINS